MGFEKTLLKFITKFFNDLPGPARVVAYFIILGLVVYQVTNPEVITGRVVMKDSDGGEIHYRGRDMMTDYAGHILKFRTNEDGIWVIPAPVISTNVRVDLAPFLGLEDEQSWHDVDIGTTDYWFKDVVKIILSDKDPKISVEPRFSSLEEFTSKITQFAEGISGQRAYAGMLGRSRKGAPVPTGEISPLPWKKVDPEKIDKIKGTVREIISNTTGLSKAEIVDDFKLRRNPDLSFISRVKIIDSLDKTLQFRIPDEHWNDLNNVGELSRYILDRKNIYEQYKFNKADDWYTIQRQIPKQDRPVFRIQPPVPPS